MSKKIVIVGGGFGGVRAALDLSKGSPKDAKIVLISDKRHFEYLPALYKVAVGQSPLEVCIPLDEIFKNKNVEVILDKISAADLSKKALKGESGSSYNFDTLILALGSETAYFNIEGLKELAFSLKSINEGLKLKKHIHGLFQSHLMATKEEAVSNLHVLIVGGGATGVELAGELCSYMIKIARAHKIDPSFITVDLIEAASRVMPMMPEDVSRNILKELRRCGVNVFLNRVVMKEDIEQVFLKDMTLKSKTVIWTAGAKTNNMYSQIGGLELDKKGRVIVDEYLQPKGMKDIFVIGDAAATPYAGLAQTAIYDGSYVAGNILKNLSGRKMEAYSPHKVSYVIPVSPNWAATMIGPFRLYGIFSVWLRRLIDLRFFLSILPFRKALDVFWGNKKFCESCDVCLHESESSS